MHKFEAVVTKWKWFLFCPERSNLFNDSSRFVRTILINHWFIVYWVSNQFLQKFSCSCALESVDLLPQNGQHIYENFLELNVWKFPVIVSMYEQSIRWLSSWRHLANSWTFIVNDFLMTLYIHFFGKRRMSWVNHIFIPICRAI